MYCTMRLCIPRTLRGYRSSSTSSLGQTYLKRRATCYKAWLGDGSRHDFRWESNTHPSEPQLRTELTTLTSSTFLKHNSKIQITERRHSQPSTLSTVQSPQSRQGARAFQTSNSYSSLKTCLSMPHNP